MLRVVSFRPWCAVSGVCGWSDSSKELEGLLAQTTGFLLKYLAPSEQEDIMNGLLTCASQDSVD